MPATATPAPPRTRPTARTAARPLALLALCTLLAACHCTPTTSMTPTSPTAPTNSPPAQAPAEGAPIPGISGMVQLRTGAYLVVHDSKDARGSRAGILSVTPGARPYTPVEIADDALAGGPLSDVEAIAPLPGRDGQFLLLESGGEGRAPTRRRLALAALDASPVARLRILAVEDIRGATPALANCEGLACWRDGDAWRLLVADRGRFRGDTAALALGTLTVSEGGLHFRPDEDPPPALPLPAPHPGDWRVCADLYIDAQGTLWGVCNQDAGDVGPFRSRIYRAGTIKDGTLHIDAPTVVYEVDGLKVEALGACSLGRAALSMGSDDERLGAVWRPLPVR